MLRIGILGYGGFGKKLARTVTEMGHSIEWTFTSKDIHWKEEATEVDWVIIATPNEFHYEQVYYSIVVRGWNVFVEKPGTLSLSSLNELYSAAGAYGCELYVDDVLRFEHLTEERPTDFVYKKWGGVSGNIIDRMAYHHFYLMDISRRWIPTINVIENTQLHKTFEIEFFGDSAPEQPYRFEYEFGHLGKKVHNIIQPVVDSEDALTKMMRHVFEDDDHSENRRLAKQATWLSQAVKLALYPQVDVIGGGIYGTTAAIKLAVAGHKVVVYEKNSDLLQAASGINQYRLHRGYHYPRSGETIDSCKRNAEPFASTYSDCILDDDEHYYAISSDNSQVTAEEYIKILDQFDLEWEPMLNGDVQVDNCDVVVKVKEHLFDPGLLRSVVHRRLVGCGVHVKLNHEAKQPTGDGITVVATYAGLNSVLLHNANYQFELCEKPLFKLPLRYRNKSIVIMDGPFMCIDPYAHSGWHLMGNVVHAIHKTNVGKHPEVPPEYVPYLNNGIIKDPKYTHVPLFIEAAKKFFPEIEEAEHIGSMYTIRTVLPNTDDTDRRPTIISKVEGEQTYVLFSGKIGNCVEAADQLVEMINE